MRGHNNVVKSADPTAAALHVRGGGLNVVTVAVAVEVAVSSSPAAEHDT